MPDNKAIIGVHDSSCWSEFFLNHPTYIQKWLEDIGPLSFHFVNSQRVHVCLRSGSYHTKVCLGYSFEMQEPTWRVISLTAEQGVFARYFFDDTGCTYYLGTISSYMEIVVFVGNDLAVITIVSRRNRDFAMCITKVLLSRPNGLGWFKPACRYDRAGTRIECTLWCSCFPVNMLS